MKRLLTMAVLCYAAFVIGLWQAVDRWSDRFWPVTLIAFGPRWLASLPLIPLLFLVVAALRGRLLWMLTGTLACAGLVLVFGLNDFRLGLNRLPGTPALRLMTQNLGESRVTAKALDQLMRDERVDVAALQECPFYDYGVERLGWRFYYGGDMCLASRYPFVVLDESDPDSAWQRGGFDPERFEIQTPSGPIQLLNVHLGTIRSGLEALRDEQWRGLPLLAKNREAALEDSRKARERARKATEPLVITGDFNLPVESAIYRNYWGGFRNAFSDCGRGFGHSKFTRWFGIRIDHVLMSSQWRCADARVLQSPFGGDHAPMIVDLVLIN